MESAIMSMVADVLSGKKMSHTGLIGQQLTRSQRGKANRLMVEFGLKYKQASKKTGTAKQKALQDIGKDIMSLDPSEKEILVSQLVEESLAALDTFQTDTYSDDAAISQMPPFFYGDAANNPNYVVDGYFGSTTAQELKDFYRDLLSGKLSYKTNTLGDLLDGKPSSESEDIDIPDLDTGVLSDEEVPDIELPSLELEDTPTR